MTVSKNQVKYILLVAETNRLAEEVKAIESRFKKIDEARTKIFVDGLTEEQQREFLTFYRENPEFNEVPHAEALEKTCADLKGAAEMLWVLLANVSGGDWTQQTEAWQEAARHWRDHYHSVLKS